MDAEAGSGTGAAPARAAFLFGVPRSGTTLLLRLLDGHPDLLVLPRETHAADWHGARDPVAAFRARRREDGPLFADSGRSEALDAWVAARLRGPADIGSALRAVVEGFARLLPAPPGARAWVEKTPKHLYRVPALRRAFGEGTRFLCLLRDPRAVAASQFTRWKRGGARHVRTFAARWAAADVVTRRFEAAMPGFRVLRYEDLLADPEGAMRGVAAHLGVPWHPSLLLPTDRGVPWAGNASSRLALPRVALEPERGTRDLSPREAALVERLLAPRMRARGYEPRDPAAGGPSAARAWIEAVARFRVLREVESLPPAPRPVSAAGAGPARPGVRLPAG